MVDPRLIQKIIFCKASLEELENFLSLDSSEYDLDNSFDKYFNLEVIVNVLELYNEKKISHNYLKKWAIAYAYIVCASHWYGENSDQGTCDLKGVAINEIGDWLDGVSWQEENGDVHYYLNLFYNKVKMYYQIYKTLPQWGVYYRISPSCCEGDDTIVILLCINESHKVFLTFETDLEHDNNYVNNKLTDEQFDEKINELIRLGYWEDSLSQRDEFY